MVRRGDAWRGGRRGHESSTRVAALQQPTPLDGCHGSPRPSGGDLLRHLLRHRDAQPLPVPPLGLAARARQPGLGLPRHPGPARGHRRDGDPAAPGQALVGLPQPVAVADRPLTRARPRAAVGRGARVLGDRPADDRVPEHPGLVPLAVVVRLDPPVHGLRRDRLDPAAHRDQAPRHQVRPAGQAGRGRRTDRDPVEREPRRPQQRRQGRAAHDAGHEPARAVRRRRVGDRGDRADHRRPDRHAPGTRRACSRPGRPRRDPRGSR